MVDFTFAHREEGFDEHIDKSIRGYSYLLDDVVSLSRHFVENDTNVYDIGCSTGKMTQRLVEANFDHCTNAKWYGIEIADGFQEELKLRHAEINKTVRQLLGVGESSKTKVYFHQQDIRNTIIKNASLVTSIFTLQFMPKKDRQNVIDSIWEGLNDGGAYIFAEKTICESARHQDMLTFNYYDHKRKSFTTDDIMNKEVTLRSMMKPNTWAEIQEMLLMAGFQEVQPFWRNHMFVGAIAIK